MQRRRAHACRGASTAASNIGWRISSAKSLRLRRDQRLCDQTVRLWRIQVFASGIAQRYAHSGMVLACFEIQKNVKKILEIKKKLNFLAIHKFLYSLGIFEMEKI